MCFLFLTEMRPAELFFQMHLLARQSKSDPKSPSNVEFCQSPEKWVLRAIHTNPSCIRYWKVLQKLMTWFGVGYGIPPNSAPGCSKSLTWLTYLYVQLCHICLESKHELPKRLQSGAHRSVWEINPSVALSGSGAAEGPHV